MKKRNILILLTIICSTPVWGLTGYYGLEGLHYVPSARTSKTGNLELALSSLPSTAENLNIYPYSFRINSTPFPGVEVALTNTYQYYMAGPLDFPWGSAPPPGDGNFVAGESNVVAPIIPSIKLGFIDEAVPNGSLAVGFMSPYGAFIAFDYSLRFKENFDLYAVAGLSTTLASLYGFGGLILDIPSPVSFILEGAYGGRIDFLTTPQETFISFGVVYDLTPNVALDFAFRMDVDMIRRLSFGYNFKFQES